MPGIQTYQLADGDILLAGGTAGGAGALKVSTMAPGNVDIASAAATYRDVVMDATKTVLLAQQDDPEQNGKYDWVAEAAPLVRSSDCSLPEHFALGTAFYIQEGLDEKKVYRIVAVSASPFVVDTTEMTIREYATKVWNLVEPQTAVPAPDGVETEFTFGAYTPRNGQLMVYVNGVRQFREIDYEQDVNTCDIVMTVPPLLGDVIKGQFFIQATL